MNSVWAGIAGVVIDAVGTVIEPDPPVADVYLAAAMRQGIVLDRSTVKARFSCCFRDDEIDEARGPLETDESIEVRRWQRIVTSVLPEVPDPEDAFHHLWSHFARPESWLCFPDVAPALTLLRQADLPVLIGSNFDARLYPVVAGIPEIQFLGDSLVISSQVGYRKPHARFYEAACNRLRLRSEQVLWVGDDPENDLFGPRRAGCRSVLLDRLGTSDREESGFPDLLAIVRGLFAAPVPSLQQ
jgi:putative hydrolase of the HAD superfamily